MIAMQVFHQRQRCFRRPYYPARRKFANRFVGLLSGGKTNAVVNQERVVNKRNREFWSGFLGRKNNRHGCVRTPRTLCRNGEYGQGGGKALTACAGARYGKTAKALALGVMR